MNAELLSPLMTGSIVPGMLDPYYRPGWVTDTRGGGPQKAERKQRILEPAAQHPLAGNGDQKHKEMLGAIKQLASVVQNVTQNTTEALKENREWRG